MNGTRITVDADGYARLVERRGHEKNFEDLSIESQELYTDNRSAKFDRQHWIDTGELRFYVAPLPSIEQTAATRAYQIALDAENYSIAGAEMTTTPGHSYQVTLEVVQKLDSLYRLLKDYNGAPDAYETSIRNQDNGQVAITLSNLKTLIQELGTAYHTLWGQVQSKKEQLASIVANFNDNTINEQEARTQIAAVVFVAP